MFGHPLADAGLVVNMGFARQNDHLLVAFIASCVSKVVHTNTTSKVSLAAEVAFTSRKLAFNAGLICS